MSYSEYYKRRIDNLRDLSTAKNNAESLLRSELKSLAEDIAERLKNQYRDSESYEMYGMKDGIKYRILKIDSYAEVFSGINACVDIVVERIDDFTPTDVEKKMLARKPKYRRGHYDKLLLWIEESAPFYEWARLKNKIFQRLHYSFDIDKDGVEKAIEHLNLNLIPIAVHE